MRKVFLLIGAMLSLTAAVSLAWHAIDTHDAASSTTETCVLCQLPSAVPVTVALYVAPSLPSCDAVFDGAAPITSFLRGVDHAGRSPPATA